VSVPTTKNVQQVNPISATPTQQNPVQNTNIAPNAFATSTPTAQVIQPGKTNVINPTIGQPSGVAVSTVGVPTVPPTSTTFAIPTSNAPTNISIPNKVTQPVVQPTQQPTQVPQFMSSQPAPVQNTQSVQPVQNTQTVPTQPISNVQANKPLTPGYPRVEPQQVPFDATQPYNNAAGKVPNSIFGAQNTPTSTPTLNVIDPTLQTNQIQQIEEVKVTAPALFNSVLPNGTSKLVTPIIPTKEPQLMPMSKKPIATIPNVTNATNATNATALI
jgi:hypothetical protein